MLEASTLSALIKSKIDSINASEGAVSNDQVCDALAQAVVEHITTAAQVVVASGSSAGTYMVT